MPEPRSGLGTSVPIDEQTVLVLGQPLDVAAGQPDVANALLHRTGQNLVLVDTGVTAEFRQALITAADQLGPWTELLVLTTHGHPDHVGNNNLLDELAETRGVTGQHFLPAADLDQMRDPEAYWVRAFRRVGGFAPMPAAPALAGIKVVSLFRPYAPFGRRSRTYESLPLRPITIGSQTLPGWSFADGAVQVLPSQGHCAGHVVVHLPGPGLLHLADELNGPCAVMPDADQVKINRVQSSAHRMLTDGALTRVTDGHSSTAGDALSDAGTAAARLDAVLAQGYALQAGVAALVGEADEIAAGDFMPRFAELYRDLGVAGANPSAVFTALMALAQLEILGFAPATAHHSHWRRQALAPRHHPVTSTTVREVYGSVETVGWLARGRQRPSRASSRASSGEQPEQRRDRHGHDEDDQDPRAQQ